MYASDPKNMKNNIPRSLLLPFAFVIIVQLFLGPAAAMAQIVPVNISEESEKKRRLDEAAIAKAEAEARKAQADADKVESDIAKQNLETRKTQLELIKSTTTVEGSLVENNIAASKAIGCAAVDIARDMSTFDNKPDLILLYSPQAATSLSEYTGLIVQLRSTSTAYTDTIPRLEKKLAPYSVKDEKFLQDKIDALEIQLAKLEARIKELEKKPTLTQSDNAELGFVTTNLAITAQTLENFRAAQKVEKGALTEGISSILGAGLTGGTAGLAISGALNLFALFKTDTTIKGTDVTPGSLDLTGYFVRARTFIGNPGLQIISPDKVVLGDVDKADSNLLSVLRELNTKYVLAKKLSTNAGNVRKLVVVRAEDQKKKPEFQEKIKEAESVVTQALKKYGEEPTDLNKARYEAAVVRLKIANANLEAVQKEIDKIVKVFDDDIATENAQLEALNAIAEALAKRLTGVQDKDAVNQHTLGDYLRAEALYKKLHPVDSENKPLAEKPVAYWLETNISANGANQMKKSSPIFDIFTRGPMLSYSGGAVVSYQMRKMDGSIVLAGTTWAFAPYRKSKNIINFECRSSKKPELDTPYKNL